MVTHGYRRKDPHDPPGQCEDANGVSKMPTFGISQPKGMTVMAFQNSEWLNSLTQYHVWFQRVSKCQALVFLTFSSVQRRYVDGVLAMCGYADRKAGNASLAAPDRKRLHVKI